MMNPSHVGRERCGLRGTTHLPSLRSPHLEKAMNVPDGFEPHFRKSPLTEPWEPLYSKLEEGCVIIGLRLAHAHTNSRGFAHGGLVAALADNAMGLSCVQRAHQRESGENVRGAVTVGLNIDYLSTASLGDWLEFRAVVIKTGRRLSFAECKVVVDEKVIARAAASFAHG